MFASIVIDIKHEEVNQLYDYIVPQAFEDFLTRGMRVIVPFGHMERLGIVVQIMDSSMTATKEVKEVLDSTPSMDDEAFMMINVISKGSPELISALYQTVIPPELLVSYQKIVQVKDFKKLPDDLLHHFSKKGIWRLNVSDQIYYPKLKRLKDQGIIDIKTVIKEKKTEKKITLYTFNPGHTYTLINKYPVVDEVMHEQTSLTKTDLLSRGLSASMISTLVKHGVFIEHEEDVKREIKHSFELESKEISLNIEQKHAVKMITAAKNHQVFLLKGITGSGKTEVYIHSIENIISQGGRVLLLVPEIQLIPQMAMRLKSQFDDVAIYHSALSKGERYDQYKSIINQESNIILGTRSACFLPIENLKLIIMDEEHDSSYIQHDGVYYDTKELMIERAKYHSIPIVLGSATPTVVSMYHAEKGIYTLLELTKRPFDLPLPKLTFVDMKEELKAKHLSILSRDLIKAIEDRMRKHEQTILFFNRKGYAPFVMCRSCGDVPKCPHCDVSLAFYKDKRLLKCPYCGHEVAFEATCHVCNEPKVKEVGAGIDYVEEQLKKYLPQARVLRMDRSEVRTKQAHEIIWNDFRKEEADILLGTQMVTKGLDFPKVTLVGVLLSDMLLKIPSYQSAENAYMIFAQATGRSGRMIKGDAIIQGYDLNHYAIQSLEKGYDAFYKEALYQRKLLGYMPFNHTSQLLFSGLSFLQTYQKAFMMKKELSSLNVDVLGPSQALIKKIKDQYRFTLTLKYQERDLKPLFDLMNKMKTDAIRIEFLPTLDTW